MSELPYFNSCFGINLSSSIHTSPIIRDPMRCGVSLALLQYFSGEHTRWWWSVSHLKESV